MKLAIRSVKFNDVKAQLLSTLELGTKDIVAIPTNYGGITLLDLNESVVKSLKSIRNIEAILLDEAAAAALLQPITANEGPSLKSLNGVDEREQYEHLSQLIITQKAMRDNR